MRAGNSGECQRTNGENGFPVRHGHFKKRNRIDCSNDSENASGNALSTFVTHFVRKRLYAKVVTLESLVNHQDKKIPQIVLAVFFMGVRRNRNRFNIQLRITRLYSLVRVSISIMSSWATNKGTWTVCFSDSTAFSIRASFNTLPDVLPLTAGSEYTT